MVRQRVRIRFRKQGDLRFLGHRDLVRALERLFRRCGLRLAMSEGFHPKPRMTFPSALAVGIEGLDEVMELELAEEHDADELRARLAAAAPAGLEFPTVEILPAGTPKVRIQGAVYRIALPAERLDEARQRAVWLLSQSSCPTSRRGGESTIDVRPFLEELTVHDGWLEMRLAMSQERSATARDVLEAMGLADLEKQGSHLVRSSLELAT